MKNLLPLALAAVMLTGCGAGGAIGGTQARAGAIAAQSQAGVNKGVRAMFEAAFKAADTNEDEWLSLEEIAEAMPTVPGQGTRLPVGIPVDPSAARKELMARLDTNADGKVRYREFARPEFVKQATTIFRLVAGNLFVQMDVNADRSLVAPEVANAQFSYTAFRGLKFDFEALDRNGNERVTLSEFEDAYAAMLVAGPDPVDPPAPGGDTPAPAPVGPQPAPADPQPAPAAPAPAPVDQP